MDIEELRVLVTGDMSDLSKTISQAEKELGGLSKNGFNSLSENSQKALKKVTASTKNYEEAVKDVKVALDKQKATFRDSTDEYKKNTKSITNNIRGLKQQQTALNSAIVSKEDEINALEKVNQTIGKNSQAYKDNKKAIQWIRNEQDELKTQYSNVTSEISKQKDALSKERTARNTARREIKEASAAYAEMESNLKAVSKQEKILKLEETGQQLKSLSGSVDTLTKPLQYTTTGLAIGGVAAAKFAIDFEDGFAAVKKTVDGTPEQLEEVKQAIIDMTTVGINGHSAIPMTTAQLNELAAAGGQLGIQTENIADFTETMAMMETATNLAGEEGAATMARFQNVMQISQDEIKNVGSAIVDLGNNSATTEAEIASMALRMGKYGNTVGMGAADVLGYSAALSSMGVEAQLGGSAVGRTWLSIEKAVANGGETLAAFAKYSGKSAKEFAQQWNTDSKGAFNSLLKGLKETENITLALAELGIDNTQDIQVMMSLANGYDLVTESVNRANKAYTENVALQNEFEAKSETTASKLQVAKQNLVETARSIGEVMLPSIADASTGVAEFAQKLSGLDDDTKKTLVGVAGSIVALGAGTKGIVMTTKTLGETAEAWGNLKKQLGKDGTLAKLGPVLKTIGTKAPIAAAAILGIGAAVGVGTVAYKKWYKAQYQWSDGLEEGNQKISESLEKYKELSSLQSQIKSQKLIIENPDSSKEQVETAKKRIEEIKELLSEEYDLVINSDNSNLDDTVEKVKEISKNDLQTSINEQKAALADVYDNMAKYQKTYAKDNEKYQKALADQEKYSDMRAEISQLNSELSSGTITLVERNKAVEELALANGFAAGVAKDYGKVLLSVNQGYRTATKNVEEYGGKVEAFNNCQKELADTTKRLADLETESVGMYTKEKDWTSVNRAIEDIGLFVREGGHDFDEYAKKVALAKNGIDSLNTAWTNAQNGKSDGLDGIVNDYITSMQQWGATAEQTAVGAALIQEGFNNIGEAVAAGKIDLITTKANELVKTLDNVPKDARIEISATGDISLISETQSKIEALLSSGEYSIGLNANGDISLLDKAGAETSYLEGIGNVNIQVNADGSISILNEANEVLATLPEEFNPKVSADADTSPAEQKIDSLDDKPVNVKVDADTTTAENKIKALDGSTVNVTVNYAETGAVPKAKGTKNFEGGLAKVNDQKGISDPRELIVDNGRAFIPEGKDVVLPLSKGAKVYTAKQTQQILKNIPAFASGKDNSDGFVTARDNWNHYTATHAVTTTQELEKWVELSKQFTQNQKDVEDIQEQIYSLTRQQREEMNELSEEYIRDRATMNDWDGFGDNAIDAFNRVKEREQDFVEDLKISQKEADDFLEQLGEDMYDTRVENSKAWLDKEVEYNNMQAEAYLESLERMKKYTLEYYQAQLIDYEKYHIAMQELDYMRLDKQREISDKEVEDWKKAADGWYEQRELYGDWEEKGDSPIDFYKRCQAQMKKFFEEGKIGWDEYNEYVIEKDMDIYRAQSDLYDEKLDKMKAHIDDVSSFYDEQMSLLEDGWTMQDFNADIRKAHADIGKYRNAVTDAGKEKLASAKENLKQANREKQRFELEQKSNSIISKLEAEYRIAEENKEKFLRESQTALANASAYVEKAEILAQNSNNLLEQILKAIINNNIDVSKFQVPVSTTTTHSSTYNYFNGIPNVEGAVRVMYNATLGGGKK